MSGRCSAALLPLALFERIKLPSLAKAANFHLTGFLMISVTTIIPVRNREHFIARAIESVCSQTYPSTEIIVVDDASTDATPHIVESLAKKLSNLALIRLTEHVGAAKARNIGAEVAKGDLLAFLDSDDTWYPEKLEKQIKELRADKEIVAVFCGTLETTTSYSFRYVPPVDISLNELYRSDRLGGCSTAVVSKKAFVQIGGFDALLPSCQDWDLSIRLAEIGKIRVVQEVLIEHYLHTGERISNNKAHLLLGHDMVFNKIYQRLSNPIQVRIIRASHQSLLAEIFLYDYFFGSTDPRRAFGHALKALALVPSPGKLQMFARAAKHVARSELRRFRKASDS